MAKVRWTKNYCNENREIGFEWIAITENKVARINRTWENTLLLEQEVKVGDIWEEAGSMAFDRVRDAKAEAEKWLRA